MWLAWEGFGKKFPFVHTNQRQTSMEDFVDSKTEIKFQGCHDFSAVPSFFDESGEEFQRK